VTGPTDPEPAVADAPPPAAAPRGDSPSPAIGLGAVLVVIGLLLFLAQMTDFDFAELGWPMIIVAIGVVVLGLGLFVNREQGMVVGGTVVSTVGLVLLYQNTTDHWQSWAYAWALVGPAASGLGLLLWGVRTANAADIRNGTWGVLGGLALFVVGYLFFEGVIGISGEPLPLPEWVLPAVIIGVGVVLLGRAMLERREPVA
jgi:hypothetical protein